MLTLTEEEEILRRRHTAQVEDMIDDTYPTAPDPTPLLRSLSSNSSNNTRTPLMEGMESSNVAEDDCAGLVNNEVREGVDEHQRDLNDYNSRLQQDNNGK